MPQRRYSLSAAEREPRRRIHGRSRFDFFLDLSLDFLGDGLTIDDRGHDLLRDAAESANRNESIARTRLN